MAHLYINPDTDSIYVDVTAGDGSPTTTAEAAGGVRLYMDEARVLVAIEVMDVSQRGGIHQGESAMGHLHVNPNTDSFYLDVSVGTRLPVDMMAVAEGVLVHVDQTGALAAIEVMGLSRRGGLRVDDLDAIPGHPRPALFDEIERVARSGGAPGLS